MSSEISVVAVGLTKTSATHTTPLVVKQGKGYTEMLTLMKKRKEQHGRINSMASEEHARRKEIDLSKLVTMHQQSLSDAWQYL